MRWIGSVAVALALSVPAASAQSLSFSPHIGIYVPTEQLYQLASGASSDDDFQLDVGPSFGATLGLWFGSRFGIEAAGSYVPTTFRLAGTGTTRPLEQDARLFIGSGQAVVYLIPRTSPLSLYLSAGVGVVSRGGLAFTNEAANSDVAGILGAGAGIRLGGFLLTAGVDFLAYDASYRGNQTTTQELQQRDLNVKLGIGIPFGGRPL